MWNKKYIVFLFKETDNIINTTDYMYNDSDKQSRKLIDHNYKPTISYEH